MQKREIKRIRFNYLDKQFYFPHRSELKAFLLKLFHKEGFQVETVNYIFCSDNYLISINKIFLHHDTFTDIITFQYSAHNEPLSSDIYISVDRVKDNAQLYNTTLLNELYRVIFHGALHLCGYKDKSQLDTQKMRSMEDYYLKRFCST